jgi:hypothetical protein
LDGLRGVGHIIASRAHGSHAQNGVSNKHSATTQTGN